MIRSVRFAYCVAILSCLMPFQTLRAGIDIGGGSIVLGGGRVDMGCSALTIAQGGSLSAEWGELANLSDMVNAGTLSGAQARFEVSGQWNNTGAFLGGQSSVIITGDCGEASVISGQSDFWNLVVSGLSGSITFQSGSLQRIANELVLLGQDAANRLVIRSSQPGQPASLVLALDGSQDIFHVNVRDIHALPVGQALAVGDPFEFQSVDAGGNRRWFRDALPPPVPVNSLTSAAALLLGLVLLLFGMRAGPMQRPIAGHGKLRKSRS